MPKPIVAIVGRPNVGKSTLFNKIVGKRISIIEDTPGVTRDRIYAEAEWAGKKFTLVDTGGIEPKSKETILVQMRLQANVAMEMADVIIFLTDLKEGLTAADKDVAVILQKCGKPVIVACNKADNISTNSYAHYEFYNLGMGDPIAVSSTHGIGTGDLLDEVVAAFSDIYSEDEEDDSIKVAVIGKPNVGKSSLINKILGEERLIVSNIAGTTRDAIDTKVAVDGKEFTFIDTAGIRRKSKVEDKVEKYSVLRSWQAIDRADICLMVIDGTEGVTEQDTKIAGYAHEQGKGIIIVVNKWDIVEKDGKTMQEFRKSFKKDLIFMTYAPSVFVSAITGLRLSNLFELISFVNEQQCMRIKTGMLNDILSEATAMVQPPSDKGKRLKIFYGTQVSVKPPTFVIFINDTKLMHFSYERYIENQIRKVFGFEGTPIRFIMREKNKKD